MTTAKGTVEQLEIDSKILRVKLPYTIYLPANFDKSKRYKILYVLHGYEGTESITIEHTKDIFDSCIANGDFSECIVVSPYGFASDKETRDKSQCTWYLNSSYVDINYEDFFIKEFMPQIEKTYNIDTKKRAIMGFSMGGFGSIMYSIKYKNMFASVSLMNTAFLDEVEEEEQDRYDFIYGNIFGVGLKGKGRTINNKIFQDNNPHALLEKIDDDELKNLNLFIALGDKDSVYRGNMLIHTALRDRNINHEFRVYGGGHLFDTRMQAFPEAMRYIEKVWSK